MISIMEGTTEQASELVMSLQIDFHLIKQVNSAMHVPPLCTYITQQFVNSSIVFICFGGQKGGGANPLEPPPTY